MPARSPTTTSLEAQALPQPEPLARRPIFVALRTTAVELWGPEVLRELGERMPERARRETVKPSAIVPEWLPEIHLLAWAQAAWEGPCAQREDEYLHFVRRTVDHSFGRVRTALLSIATPMMLGAKAAQLWRHDYTHGTLEVAKTGLHEMTLTLRGCVQTTTELGQRTTTEVYRHACSLTRCKDVRATSAPRGDRLVVRVQWR